MQVKVYLANLKLNRIYHFEKQEIIANDYLTQTRVLKYNKKEYDKSYINDFHIHISWRDLRLYFISTNLRCAQDSAEMRSNMEDKRFALLIDADNISAKYISPILDEMAKYGITTYRRIYGDWTSTQATKWKLELLENSLIPIQQFSNTVGKNATDSSLIIDAMDILYTQRVDGFCIVSSDADFTRLASRIRESGMIVIGMGEKKTPRAFMAACTKFTNLENLVDQDEEGQEEGQEEVKSVSAVSSKDKELISKTIIEKTVIGIITENENKGKETGLGEIGSRLGNKYPDFDTRNYGYSLLSKFLEEGLNFKLQKNQSTIIVKLKDSEKSGEEIMEYVTMLVKAGGTKGIGISELSNTTHMKFNDFNIKDLGYSQFSKFVQSIDGIEVYEGSNKRKRARLKKTK